MCHIQYSRSHPITHPNSVDNYPALGNNVDNANTVELHAFNTNWLRVICIPAANVFQTIQQYSMLHSAIN